MSGGRTTPLTPTSLTDLVGIMREQGISSLKWGEVEIVLAPKRLAIPDEPVDNDAKPRKIVKMGVRGKDGLTAEQQEEWYGTIRDATPPEYED